MKYIAGRILTDAGFKRGYIKVSMNKIIEMNFGSCPKTPDLRGLITPSFVNMHTHLGDAFISQKNINLPHDIMKLVAPPDGLKHQLLKKSTDDEIIKGMKQAIQTMVSNGTSCFFDFRENGEHGINIIKTALEHFPIESFILSRPKELQVDENEILRLLNISEGIGLSSISDWEFEDVEQIRSLTKKRKKLFSIHVSERIRENINKIIKLQPDFIIHMTKASKKDLLLIKKENIPIVVCPQSNTFFNMSPPLELMKEIGNTILLGTDNAMINSPKIIDEINHIKNIAPNVFNNEDLLEMITYLPRKVLNLNDYMQDAKFLSSNYIILDERTLQPIGNEVVGSEMI